MSCSKKAPEPGPQRQGGAESGVPSLWVGVGRQAGGAVRRGLTGTGLAHVPPLPPPCPTSPHSALDPPLHAEQMGPLGHVLSPPLKLLLFFSGKKSLRGPSGPKPSQQISSAGSSGAWRPFLL